MVGWGRSHKEKEIEYIVVENQGQDQSGRIKWGGGRREE